ncbi:MAG: hypothetical protein R3Y22_08555 [Bacteroidales bacterium]
MTKRLTIILIAILPLFVLTSCDEIFDSTSVYKYGVTSFYSTSGSVTSDLYAISELYADYGLYLEQEFEIKGISYKSNDVLAISDFEQLINSVSDAQIERLGLSKGTTFTIALMDMLVPADEDNVIAFYTYIEY